MTLTMAQWLFNKVKRSKGMTRLFWLAVIGVAAVVAFGGVGPLMDKIKSQLPAGVQDKLPDVVNQLPGSNSGPIQVYFTEPTGSSYEKEAIAKACVAKIDAAKESIDVAAFELDNAVIIDALVRATARGVRVRLVTDTDYVHETGVTALRGAGVPVVDDKREALMHNKFMVFDKKAVWTGSMNFTENCAYRNNNNGLYIESPELAANYATRFGWMFDDKNFGAPTKKLIWGKQDAIPHPVVRLSDGTVIESYFSPGDHIADKATSLVNEARQSVHFLAFSFTHEKIGAAMLDRNRAGVKVLGVFEKSQAASGYSQFNKLHAAGLPVYIDANPRNMHHKVIVVDGETTLAGSFNFSDSADKSNDENALIIRNNKAVGQKFEGEFQKVYNQAAGAK